MWRVCGLVWLTVALAAQEPVEVYRNEFNATVGTSYSEWTATRRQTPAVIESPNHAQRFLGEFGGEKLVSGPPFVRVNQTVSLKLQDLPVHKQLRVEFDLLILKSWDGNNPNYRPDLWKLRVAGGNLLLDTSFSNNHKTAPYDLSLQNYPRPDSPPQTGATAVNTLGYQFFGDSTYHLRVTFPHTAPALQLDFSSSLFEGKGTDDESWGLKNVRVTAR